MDKISEINQSEPMPELLPYIDEFVKNRYEDLEAMKEHFAENDLEKVKGIAHSWKGFSEPYGFPVLKDLAVELEMLIKNGEKINSKLYLERIQSYLQERSKSINNL